MSSGLDTDIDETFKVFGKLTGNWGTYVLTITKEADLKLLEGRTFITNYKEAAAKWTWFGLDDTTAGSFCFDQWEGTQVIFVADIARAAGFQMESIDGE